MSRQNPLPLQIGWVLLSSVWLLGLSGCQQANQPPAMTLVYELDAPDGISPEELAELTETARLAIQDRAAGIATVKSSKPGQVEVEIPPPFSKDDLPAMRRLLETYGELRLSVAANPRDHADLIALAGQTKDDEVRDENDYLWGQWFDVRILGEEDNFNPDWYVVRGGVTESDQESNHDEHGRKQMLIATDPLDVVGSDVLRADIFEDPQGRPSIAVVLTDLGGRKMQAITRRYQPEDEGTSVFRRHLAIIINGRVYSAPTINAVMGTHISIEGDFDRQGLVPIINAFQSGTLPCRVKLIEQR